MNQPPSTAAPTEDELRDVLITVLDSLDPHTVPQACCEAAMALDALIDPASPPPLMPMSAPVHVAPELARALDMASMLIDRATSVAAALALSSCARHLRAAADSLPTTS